MALVIVPSSLGEEGLTIRRLTEHDLETLQGAVPRNRDYLAPWVGGWIHREPISREERFEELTRWIEGYDHGRAPNLMIEECGEFVGMIGLHDRNGPAEVEIGYWIDQDHQGRGIATRATRLLATFALRHPSVERVLLRHRVDNVPSRRVAEKSGFRLLLAEEVHDNDLFTLWELRRSDLASH